MKFLALDSYKNIYKWASRTSAVSGRGTSEIIEEKLDAYYPKRQGFDEMFENSHEFNYGALNIGGLGAQAYGDYCVVLSDNFAMTAKDLVYLQSDSLNEYVNDFGEVDVSRLASESSTHEFRNFLAGIKLGNQIATVDESAWPSTLCSKRDYIEAIFSAEVRSGSVKEIRIAQFDFELYFMFAFENFRRHLGEADRYIIDNFTTILDLVDQQGLILTRIDIA